MEQVLNKIGSSKTFSISRNAKKIFENDEIFDHMIDEIPAPAPMTISKKPETKINKKQTQNIIESNQKMQRNYSDFIKNDRNIYIQRKILLQQELLQKQCTNLTNSRIFNTNGLLQEGLGGGGGGGGEEIRYHETTLKEIDISTWPQCKQTSVYFELNNFVFR
jgi:hypothetical protein